MRLLVVSQVFWPESFRINDLVEELVGRGHEVTVLTGLPNYPEGVVFPEYRADPAKYREFRGARVLRAPILARGKGRVRLVLNYAAFAVSASLAGAWRLRGERFDVILVFQPSPITSALPALAIGRLKGCPVVLWTLDLWPETLRAVGVIRSPRLLALVGVLVTFIYRRCALVLGQSRAFAPSIERYAGDGARFRYFPQWADAVFAGDPAAIEPAPETRPFADGFNVLFAGNIGEAQDFPAILDAAERLRARRDVRWLIVGDGRAVDWLRAEIARRDLGGQVILLGRHPLERMPAFFRAAGALLVALRPDPVFAMTIPGKVQSYLAAGVPIAAMLDGEGARVVSESGAGLACPAGDSAGLAAAVERLAGLSAAERGAMGARGRAYAAAHFDRQRLVRQLEGWLDEAASGRRGS